MGITYVDGTVSTGAAQEAVRFLVDSGATYTLLPKAVWERLGLTPKRVVACELADGTRLERSVSECHISLPQGEAHTPVILGEAPDEALLGVVTLEILGLVLIRADSSADADAALTCPEQGPGQEPPGLSVLDRAPRSIMPSSRSHQTKRKFGTSSPESADRS